jgi:hypothetical protein
MPHRDYRYRLIVPKSVWEKVVSELAEEQVSSNFKNHKTGFYLPPK